MPKQVRCIVFSREEVLAAPVEHRRRRKLPPGHLFVSGGFRTGSRDYIGNLTDLQPGKWWLLPTSFVGP